MIGGDGITEHMTFTIGSWERPLTLPEGCNHCSAAIQYRGTHETGIGCDTSMDADTVGRNVLKDLPDPMPLE